MLNPNPGTNISRLSEHPISLIASFLSLKDRLRFCRLTRQINLDTAWLCPQERLLHKTLCGTATEAQILNNLEDPIYLALLSNLNEPMVRQLSGKYELELLTMINQKIEHIRLAPILMRQRFLLETLAKRVCLSLLYLAIGVGSITLGIKLKDPTGLLFVVGGIAILGGLFSLWALYDFCHANEANFASDFCNRARTGTRRNLQSPGWAWLAHNNTVHRTSNTSLPHQQAASTLSPNDMTSVPLLAENSGPEAV